MVFALILDPDLFEGDIVLTEKQKIQLVQGGLDPNVPLAAKTDKHWPKIIAYEIDNKLCKY